MKLPPNLVSAEEPAKPKTQPAARPASSHSKTEALNLELIPIPDQVEAKQWQMLDLYAVKEWTPREVARVMGVSVGRVYLVKHRVSALLKKELKRMEARGRGEAAAQPMQ